MRDVAIVSYAQTKYVRTERVRNEVEMLMPVIDEVISRSGIPRREIGFTCSGSTDYLAGQSFSFVMAVDAVGAWPPAEPAPQTPSGPNRRDLTKLRDRLVKQVSQAEAEIAELETHIKDRDQELADPALYQKFSRWNELHHEQEKWKKDLERFTARWTDLSQELEDVKKKLAG